MTPGRIACVLAVLAAVCVLATFFFPGMEGPYPAVHGPVTALLSLRAATRLRGRIRDASESTYGVAGRSRMPEVSRFFVADFLLRQLPDFFTLNCSAESRFGHVRGFAAVTIEQVFPPFQA